MSPIRWLALLALNVPFALVAQTTVPTASQAIAARTYTTGAAAETIDLKSHFTIPGVTGEVAQFNTTSGKVNVELLANDAPKHVANFITYVNFGAYTNTLIHRVASFDTTAPAIVQGGGYKTVIPPTEVPKNAAVELEYKIANSRGTLAAARTSAINSATSEWYFNTTENSTTLGPSNGGGYTVFGRVIGTGMTVVDAIASTPRFNAGSPFSEIPLRNYTSGSTVQVTNFMVVNSVTIVPIHPTPGTAGSVITYTAESAAPSVATVMVNQSALTITPVSPGTTNVTVTATDTNNNKATATFSVTVAGPTITEHPASQTVAPGSPVTFSVSATSSSALTYQWQKEGAAIAGATGATFTIAATQTSDAAAYIVRVTDSNGTVTSLPATLQVATPVVGRLIGLSVLTQVNAGTPLIVGFGTRGSGEQSLLVRGIGPTLATFQVPSPLSDPRLDVFADGTAGAVASNDNWSVDSGSDKSFPLAVGSKDAVLRTKLVTGVNRTVHLNASTSTSGAALVEAFDIGATGDVQLLSVSTLKPIAVGEVLTAGVAISGNVPKKLLIRGVGPTLATVGVTGFLANPQLKLFRGDTPLLANDDWEQNGNVAAIRATPTGFPLASGSKDAAILVVLPPATNYTVQVSGVGTSSGTVLVEVTEIP